jgi:hypothetical protein
MGVEGQYNVANAIYLHIHTIQFLQMVGTSLQFLFSDTVPRQQKVVTSTFHIMSKPERQLILFFHHHTLGVCGRHLINLHVQPTKKPKKHVWPTWVRTITIFHVPHVGKELLTPLQNMTSPLVLRSYFMLFPLLIKINVFLRMLKVQVQLSVNILITR